MKEGGDGVVNINGVKNVVVVGILDGGHVKWLSSAIKVLLNERFVVLMLE